MSKALRNLQYFLCGASTSKRFKTMATNNVMHISFISRSRTARSHTSRAPVASVAFYDLSRSETLVEARTIGHIAGTE